MRHEQIMGRSVARDARENGWCIVRTNGRRTLRLAQSLTEAGIDAWTPRTWTKRRLSRIHMGFRDIEQPVVPSFVFVRARHVADLLRIIAMPTSPHPSFHIFLHGGRAPVVSDSEIEHLKKIEQDDADKRARRLAHEERMAAMSKRAQRRAMRYPIEVGSAVEPTEGAFAGMSGVVERVQGGNAVVRFGDDFVVKIATWLLVDEAVEAA